ncbi:MULTISPECIES: cytochrome P450 [unclassified Pseudofrankia]|uniref:cytochrome P450 n=1 Tax=unclassified Pseudofrankia TaxID=2994372 RepID=UPI0008D930A7|nr:MULTISPECIES: cytochrome P450 [unclassified Pseudofrankia]MDT3439903.1 cytochrome P450 [Pseudofrankia sp. BMG5.37]OHV48375.1 cytochrome [Pseudofrankia sp. BMG5.36]
MTAASTATAPKIDLLDAASFANGQPHDQFTWLREHDPVHRHDEPDGPGFWAVTRYEDVRHVGRDPGTFSNSPSVQIVDVHGDGASMGDHQMMLMMDPPRHSKYRKLVSPDFVPRSVRPLIHRVDALARQIVDAVIERGECDLVDDLAGEMPSLVIADLLGMPLEDGRELYKLTEQMHAVPDTVPEGTQLNAALKMFTYASELQAAKRRNPGDDLSSRLLAAEVEGHRLDEMDFNLFFMLLIDAGGDTTRQLVGGGLHALFERPDQRAALMADLDGRLDTAIEEMLRWVSPVVYMRRTVTTDTELRGRQIGAGDKVVMYYGSANRDERVFANPQTFDITRSPNDHIAFGSGGPHFCLGSHLARVEITALLREILTRMPDIEPAGPTTWLQSNFISGPRHLPVRFTPGPKLGS